MAPLVGARKRIATVQRKHVISMFIMLTLDYWKMSMMMAYGGLSLSAKLVRLT